MNPRPDHSALLQSFEKRDWNAAIDRLTGALDQPWWAPGQCHLLGLLQLAQALDHEARGESEAGEQVWRQAFAHLAFAIEHPDYLNQFRVARESVYGFPVPDDAVEAARSAFADMVTATLDRLESEYHGKQEDDDARRIRRLRDRWRLELTSCRLFRALGGVSIDDGGEHRIVAGPVFLDLYGHTDTVLGQVFVAGDDDWDTREFLLRLVNTEQNEFETRRKLRYCFSELAIPFVRFDARDLEGALSALRTFTEQPDETAVAREELPTSTARRRGMDARRLASEIRLEIGSEYLGRSGAEQHEAGLAYWGEALRDVAILDAQVTNSFLRQGMKLRQEMLDRVRARVGVLKDRDSGEEAQALAEGLHRILQDEESALILAQFLRSRAVSKANDDDDYVRAGELLRRARELVPTFPKINDDLIAVMDLQVKRALSEEDLHGAADACTDLLSHIEDLLRTRSEDEGLKGKKEEFVPVLFGILKSIGDQAKEEGDEEFVSVGMGFLQSILTDDVMMYSRADAVRLFRRAIRRLDQDEVEGAYEDASRAFRLVPEEEAVRGLFVNVTRQAVARLCTVGEHDKAQNIAEAALEIAPDEKAVRGARVQVMLSRLGVERLLTEDATELTTVETLLSSWLGKGANPDEFERRGRRYAAGLDRSSGNERRMAKARELARMHQFQRALQLLDLVEAEGRDTIGPECLRAQCRREMGDLDEAVAITERVVKDFPEYAFCHNAHGRALAYAGRFEEAHDALTVAREANDDDYSVVRDLARNAYWAGDHEDAVGGFGLSAAHGVGGAADACLHALCLFHLNRDDEVPGLMERFVPSFAGDPWYSKLMGWFLGEVPDEELLALAETDVQQSESYFYVGEKWRAKGRRAEGEKLLLKCLDVGLRMHIEAQSAEAMRRGNRLTTLM